MKNIMAIPCAVAFIATTLSMGAAQEVGKSSYVQGRNFSSVIKATPPGKAVFTSTTNGDFLMEKGTWQRLVPKPAISRDAIRTRTPLPRWEQTRDIQYIDGHTIPVDDYW